MRETVVRWLGAMVVSMTLAAMTVPARAEEGQAGLKEVQLAAGAFSRGLPVPDWAQLAPLPTLSATGRAMVVHLADTHLQVSGTPAWVSNRVVQANDSGLLGRLGQVALQFNPAYQKLSLHRLAVLRNGQVIDHTGTVPVRFLQREMQLEQGIYNGVITASLVLPDIRVGDALHLVYSVVGSNPIMGARYSESASWEETTPVLHRRVTLLSPAERRIAWRWIGDGRGTRLPEPVEQVQAGLRRTVFEARGMTAVDIEPNMPAYARPVHWLQFSEYASWAEVGQWAAELFQQPESLPTELGPVLARLRALPDDEARASEALRWVQDNIRYHSVLLGESSHRPHAAAEVLSNRYGDCKDKTLLLVGMLRALGIEADPVLASLRIRRNMSGMLPSPDVFDHAVVRVRLGGNAYFVDPTRTGQTGTLARMGQHLEDAEVFPARADSQGPVVVRSVLRSEVFRNTLVERFTLDAFEGDGQLDTEMILNGLDAETFRAALPQLDDVQKRQWALSGYDKRYPGLALVRGPEFTDDPIQNRMRITSGYRVPKLVREVNGAWVMNYQAANLRGSVLIPERITRQFPVLMPSYPNTLQYQVQMRWPESVGVVNDPSTRAIESPFFRARIESSFRGRDASLKLVFESLAPDVQATELPTLIEEVRKLDREVGGVLVVGRDEIKREGLFGLGRQSAMDKMRERLKVTVQATGRALAGGRLTGDDLAEALCTRGEAHADLGEAALGLVDAEVAVKRVPESGRSWQCRGNLNFSNGRFDAAVSDFSRALVMGQDAFMVHYRRGIARYYQGQLSLAAEDFARATALQDDESDRLYARLWHAWTLRQLGRPLPEDLERASRVSPTGDWPRPALALQAGLLSPEQMMAEVNKKSGDDQHMALAEAWFYLGQHLKTQGQVERAADAFRQTVSKGMTVYIEHVAAGFELQPPFTPR